jgi:type III secretion protein L
MTVMPGKIVRAAEASTHSVQSSELLGARALQTTVVAAFRVRALEDGTEILAKARAEADALLARAEVEAAQVRARVLDDARKQALAELAAETLALENRKATLQDASLDRIADLALLVGERLIGETIEMNPARVRVLAEQALRATQGAEALRVEVHPQDANEVEAFLQALPAIRVQIAHNAELSRGSMLLHTQRGTVDARIHAQLDLLRGTLRSVLRG